MVHRRGLHLAKGRGVSLLSAGRKKKNKKPWDGIHIGVFRAIDSAPREMCGVGLHVGFQTRGARSP